MVVFLLVIIVLLLCYMSGILGWVLAGLAIPAILLGLLMLVGEVVTRMEAYAERVNSGQRFTALESLVMALGLPTAPEVARRVAQRRGQAS